MIFIFTSISILKSQRQRKRKILLFLSVTNFKELICRLPSVFVEKLFNQSENLGKSKVIDS